MAIQAYQPTDRRFYEEKLASFLPEQIIDAHTHVWRKEFKLPSPDPAAVRGAQWFKLAGEEHTVEQMMEAWDLLFPGRRVTPVLFGKVSRDYDVDANNRYVAETAARYTYPALCVTRPEWDAGRFETAIQACGGRGAKVYLNFAPAYIPSREIRIFDFIPPHQLDVLHRRRWALMLHIPRPQRLRDPVNLAQMVEIARTYPGCKTIIAHIGRAYCPEDVGEAFTVLKDAPGLYYDFSANSNAWVMEQMIRHAGPGRILYGSDAPLNRLRMGRLCEQGRYVNLVPRGLYGDVSSYPDLREVDGSAAEQLTLFTYVSIDAFRRAAERTGLGPAEVRAVFHDNAQALFGVLPRDAETGR